MVLYMVYIYKYIYMVLYMVLYSPDAKVLQNTSPISRKDNKSGLPWVPNGRVWATLW